MRRRNVFKVSVAYTILSWLLIKFVDSLSPVTGTNDRVIQIVTMVLILAFPIIVLFAWAYEITPVGLKPTSQVDKTQSITAETGRKLNYTLLILLGIAAVVFLVENIL
jgi:hypothetical protein